MSSLVTLKATGLQTQPNQLGLPEGSLSVASNVVINRDNVVEKRRGFKLYGNSFGSSTDILKQLMEYRDRLIRHYSNKLQYDNGSGTFTDFPGTFSEPETGIRIKSVASNNNFYFTTSEGIKKLASSSSNLDNSVLSNAGGVKAIDITSALKYTYGSSTGFLPEDSTVAYRAVWGIKDVNGNLILGTPSPRSEIYNPITNLMTQDFLRLLQGLDNAAQVPGGQTLTDTNYVSTLGISVNASATELRSGLLSLAAKIDTDVYPALPVLSSPNPTYSAGPPQTVTYTFTSAHGLSIGDNIKVTGVIPDAYNGLYTVQSVPSSTKITVTVDANPGTYGSGGVITKIKYQFIAQPDALDTFPTAAELLSCQTYMDNIIQTLQSSPTSEISASNVSTYIDPLSITDTASVNLTVYIPQDVISAGVNEYFLQLYRSSISQATGTTVLSDLVPNDEMKLVYEAFPTSAELAAGVMKFEDVTSDIFAGAYLYTNEATGEGALAANDAPPYAKDMARFKNVVFFANTKTKQTKLMSLLGVQNMLADYNSGTTPKLTLTNGTETVTYSFVAGLSQIVDFTCIADSSDSLNGTYFDFYSANDETHYRFYYKTSGGADTPPSVTTETLVKIDILTGASASSVAAKTRDAINTNTSDFTAQDNTLPTIRIINNASGYTTYPTIGTTGFSSVIVQAGRGSSNATSPKEILLSSSISPATAVDETARSIVNIINKDSASPVYAYYLSAANGVPGKIQFEAKNVDSDTLYLLSNNSVTGSSFNPDISPTSNITSITAGATTLITTSAPHGLANADTVVISSSTSPTNIDGKYSVTIQSSTTFTIPVDTSLMTPGSYTAVYSKTSATESSENSTKPNRVYYSKLNQPEAVPIVNYFDVGDSDKSISRIIALRDSLFIFKEEGLYRVSGEIAPFTLSLFDSSCKLIAPDSLGIVANLIFGWTKKGIETISESGVSLVGRNIDTDLIVKTGSNYTNFKTATFGLGYESDKSYMFWTLANPTDTVASICYRYGTVTGAWTTFDKSNNCGIVKLQEDKLFLGAGDINYTEEERKTFSRLDYSDRELDFNIASENFSGSTIKFVNVSSFSVGDVLVQEQTLTPYTYNMLLKKLDLDPGTGYNQFYSTLESFPGNNMRTKLVALTDQLDSLGLFYTDYTAQISQKSGAIGAQSIGGSLVQVTATNHGLKTGRYINISGNTSTPSINGNWTVTVLDANTFEINTTVTTAVVDGNFITLDDSFSDIQGCYNLTISKLNADQTVAFSNYLPITTTTTIEAIVTAINKVTKIVTLNISLPYVTGTCVLHKAYNSSVVYSPVTMGDPLGYKHVREATLMFESKAFTNAILSFGSDLLPAYNPIPFNGDGNGIYGHNKYGEGFFGGASHGAPFRTLIPRNNQRCRYLNIKLDHNVARENIVLYGITVTGEISYSSRAYRG